MNTSPTNPNILPGTEYGRLLFALTFVFESFGPHSRMVDVAELLGVRQSSLTDCIRRGGVVMPKVLEAAVAKGIRSDFIKKGTVPVLMQSVLPQQQ